MFSNTAKYAIRATLYLALKQQEQVKEKVGIKQMAKDLNLPVYFLGKIMQTLAKHKILKSYKGPNGGFLFNKNPDEISLLDIIKIFDGTEIFDNCFLGLNLCKNNKEMKTLCPFADNLDMCVLKIKNSLEQKKIGLIAKSLQQLDQIIEI